jgi:hypothetical protein
MFRPLSALLVLTLPTLVPAAAQRDDQKPRLYHPIQVGAKWVYQDGQEDLTLVATAVDQKDGAKVVTVARVAGDKQVPHYKMAVSEKGLYILQMSQLDFDPPMCRLKFPHKPGDTWEVNVPGRPNFRELKCTVTVHPPAAVEVPAGKYTAIRVEWDGTDSGMPRRMTEWYAPGVGLVKRVTDAPKGEQVLKSFTPGKE